MHQHQGAGPTHVSTCLDAESVRIIARTTTVKFPIDTGFFGTIHWSSRFLLAFYTRGDACCYSTNAISQLIPTTREKKEEGAWSNGGLGPRGGVHDHVGAALAGPAAACRCRGRAAA
jgi:hypothetical protein